MKGKKILVCVVFALYVLLASKSAGYDVPGGVVASNGKVAFYCDLKTKKVEPLTADLKDAVVKPPFAVSEDGKTIVWLQDSKLHTRRLPSGQERILKSDLIISGDVWHRKVTTKIHDFVLTAEEQGSIKNMLLSPSGQGLCYETQKTKGLPRSWQLVAPGSPLDRAWLVRSSFLSPDVLRRYMTWPMYMECPPDSFDGVEILDLEPNLIIRRYWTCGNGVKYPGALPCRKPGVTVPDALNASTLGYMTVPNVCPQFTITAQEATKWFSQKRNAYLPDWSKDSQMLAVIYQTAYGWGPIEIQDVNKARDKTKPGVYEIAIQLESCDCLAWKPDGSLTYLVKGEVYLLDSQQIRQGIANSGIADNPDAGRPSLTSSAKHIQIRVVVNNVFNVTPEKVAYNIPAKRICWVSNSAFIFRGEDNGLHLWNNGQIEQLLPNVPEDFSYCKTSPIEETAGLKIASASFSPAPGAYVPEATSGKDRAPEATIDGVKGVASFQVGAIKMQWRSLSSNGINMNIFRQEFALLEESYLESIKDPSVYEYKKNASRQHFVAVGLNKIIIFRAGSAYAAIKPTGLAVSKEIRTGRTEIYYDWMDYEWKFWPKVSPIKVASVKKADLAKAK